MEEKQLSKRKRGAQPGNHNRRTHGFYSRAPLPAEVGHILEARDIGGLECEIALARVKIASIQRVAPQSYTTTFRAMASLIRLIKTQDTLEKASRRGRPRSRRRQFDADDI